MMQRIVNQAAGLFAGAMLVILALLASSSAGARMPQAEIAAPVVEPLAVSQVFHYQGRLLTPGTGEPKADGTYQMSFSIYNVAGGGSPLWTESKPVQVTNGAFSTLLGDTTPLPLGIFDGQELFLGVTLVGDPEATPRQRLAHVAYAMRAETAGSAGSANTANTANSATNASNADTLDGQDSTAFAAATHSHSQFSLLPIAFGFIRADGTKASGTSNVSSVWEPSLSRYRITITGHDYFWLNYATMVTVDDTCPNAKATTNSVGGNLLVFVYNSGGSLAQCPFQFVTFRP